MRAFYSLAAQEDNLGDIAIRQIMVTKIHAAGVNQGIAYAGRMSRSYIECFHLPNEHRITRSRVYFSLTLLAATFRRTAAVYWAPGPTPGLTYKTVPRYLALVFFSIVLRKTGNRVFVHGRSFAGTSRIERAIFRRLARTANQFTCRDQRSIDWLDCPNATWAPDLALGLSVPASTDGGGKRLSLSIRADDAGISESFAARIANAAVHAGYTVNTITQVARDDAFHVRLGQLVEASAVCWANRTHSEQLAAVLQAYGSCDVVVTNRLHSAIFALISDCNVLTIGDRGAGKVSQTLAEFKLGSVLKTDSEEELIRKFDHEKATAETMKTMRAALDQSRWI